jgi:hypothetical protein
MSMQSHLSNKELLIITHQLSCMLVLSHPLQYYYYLTSLEWLLCHLYCTDILLWAFYSVFFFWLSSGP